MHPYEQIPMNISGYVLAAWLIGFHLWMLVKKEHAKKFLLAFPRNFIWGAVLMSIGMLWFWLLIVPGMEGNLIGYLSMNLGEFQGIKKILVLLIPVVTYLMITQVKEFLAVRATGVLALMAAAPLLYSCFQDWPTARFLLPTYAYLMLTAGLFMVGMPFLLRDIIGWAAKNDKRWLICATGGLCYGIAVLVSSYLFWSGY